MNLSIEFKNTHPLKKKKNTQSIAHTCEENLYDKSLYSLSGASEIKKKWICY